MRELRMLGSVGGGLAVSPWFSLNGHLAGNGGNGQGSTYRLTVSSLSRQPAWAGRTGQRFYFQHPAQ